MYQFPDREWDGILIPGESTSVLDAVPPSSVLVGAVMLMQNQKAVADRP